MKDTTKTRHSRHILRSMGATLAGLFATLIIAAQPESSRSLSQIVHAIEPGNLILTKGESIVVTSSKANTPSADLKALDRLVGTWRVSGDAEGEVRYEWIEGGFFLLQHFDLVHTGHKSRGIEAIGHLHGFGEEPGSDIRTRVYSFLDGLTLDYVYEVSGDTLTIWGGEKGSPAYFKGTFSKDGNILKGSWVYPGGGYSTTSTRVK